MPRVSKEIRHKVPDQVFLNLVREFHSNLQLEDLSLKSSVRGIKIDIHIDQFERMFEFHFYEVSYTYGGSTKLKKTFHRHHLLYHESHKGYETSYQINLLKEKDLCIQLLDHKDIPSKAGQP